MIVSGYKDGDFRIFDFARISVNQVFVARQQDTILQATVLDDNRISNLVALISIFLVVSHDVKSIGAQHLDQLHFSKRTVKEKDWWFVKLRLSSSNLGLLL